MSSIAMTKREMKEEEGKENQGHPHLYSRERKEKKTLEKEEKKESV